MTTFQRRAEVIRDFLDSVGNLDFDRAGRCLTDDAVMTLPFVDGLPPTVGRAAIIGQLAGSVPLLFERMAFCYDAFYEVRDTDTVITEYHSECARKSDAGMYRNTYITVFGFNGEQIVLYREYLNPMRMAELT